MAFARDPGTLLDRAVSSLNPEIFSHRVWVRFSGGVLSESSGIVDNLLRAVKELTEVEPGTACQFLLISAFFQNHNGQHLNALNTLRRAISLARGASLVKETIWALWGACAISIQQGNMQQAQCDFVDLQAALNQQDEWILADMVDVIRQALLQGIYVGNPRQSDSGSDPQFEEMLFFTLNWLQHWGSVGSALGAESAQSSQLTLQRSPRSFFSVQGWQGRWQSLVLRFRSELRFEWTKQSVSPEQRPVSRWSSHLRSLITRPRGQKTDTAARSKLPQFPEVSVVTSQEERLSPRPANLGKKKRSKSDVAKANGNQGADREVAKVPVAVHMLGSFSMTIGELPVKLLPASRGLSLLRYLLLHHRQNTPREVLMDIFWPDANPETARNSLNVAVYSLRKALRSVMFLPLIIFEDGGYRLEPSLDIWLDVEEFERRVNAGQRLERRDQSTTAVAEYEAAISLYQGDLLEQNPYEEWMIIDRERLRLAYLDTLDRLGQIYFIQEHYAACITACQLMLARDRCREDVHCLLMRCYSRQRQYHLALRQYQRCEAALRADLEVEPAAETAKLSEQIRRREFV